jgi:predicted RNA binding protein YcfA (HicA-like mRNA interferase family)
VTTTSLTAAACVTRLIALGFRVGTTGTSMTLLRKAERRVIVPHVVIEPLMLNAILRSAGISHAEFVGRPARSGVYTKTTPPAEIGARKTGDRDGD